VYSIRSRKSTSVDSEHSSSSVKFADDDVTDDVTAEEVDDDNNDDDEIGLRRLHVRLSRSGQLGFGFSAAGERPTTIRSVIKGRPTSV